MLYLLGKPVLIILQVILGSGMSQFLLKSLFVVQKKTNEADVFSQINSRKPFKMRLCGRLFNKSNWSKTKRAQSLIDEQLDIVSFVRNSFMIQTQRKVLFTKLERYLLRNQIYPFVVNSKQQTTSSDNSAKKFSLENIQEQIAESNYYDKLAQGAVYQI